MLDNVKKFFSRAKGRVRALSVVVISAVSAAATSAIASAADTSGSAPDTTSMLQDAGNQLTTQFNSLVSAVIPVILGILGSGLVIFGIMALIRLAKKVFGKVAG